MSYAVLCFVVKKNLNNDRQTHVTFQQKNKKVIRAYVMVEQTNLQPRVM